MGVDLEIRIGATKKIRHTSVEAAATPTEVSGTVYDPQGNAVASAEGSAAAGAASGIYDVWFLFSTAGLDPGDYTYVLSYTDDGETLLLQGEVTLLPVASCYDRWVRRVGAWLAEVPRDDERELRKRQVRDAIDTAVTEYNKVCSRAAVVDVDLAANVWEYALPEGWVNGRSALLAVEYPVDDSEQVRTWLPPIGWEVDELRGVWRFAAGSPDLGETARLYCRLPHLLREATGGAAAADTIPEDDFHAVAQYAAGLCLLVLANRAPRTNAPEASAGIVTSRTKEQEYGKRADVMMKAALESWSASAALAAASALPPDAPEVAATWGYQAWHERTAFGRRSPYRTDWTDEVDGP